MLSRASWFVCACVIGGCTGSDPSQEEIWQAREPARYVVQTCSALSHSCLRAAVADGEVVAAEMRPEGSARWRSASLDRHPLDDLWEHGQSGEVEGCPVRGIVYNDEFGYLAWSA